MQLGEHQTRIFVASNIPANWNVRINDERTIIGITADVP